MNSMSVEDLAAHPLNLHTIETVRTRYTRLWLTTHSDGTGIERLPPHLCRWLNAGDPRATAAPDEITAHLGRRGGELIPIGEGPVRFLCGTDLAAETLNVLGLDDFMAVRPSNGSLELLSEAVDSLPRVWRPAADTVGDFLRLIVWLKRRPDAKAAAALASCSFYDLPFAVFLTSLATRHIPPHFILPERSPYPVQESLYHEALHQQVSETQHLNGHFRSLEARRGVRIFVPWHNTHWSADHALQALLVYVHLAMMRSAVADTEPPANRVVLADARATAITSARQLSAGLMEHLGIFTEAGRTLLEGLKKHLIHLQAR